MKENYTDSEIRLRGIMLINTIELFYKNNCYELQVYYKEMWYTPVGALHCACEHRLKVQSFIYVSVPQHSEKSRLFTLAQ